MKLSTVAQPDAGLSTNLVLQLRCHSQFAQNWAVHNNWSWLDVTLAGNDWEKGGAYCFGAVVLTCKYVTSEESRLIRSAVA